jgi:hypothetical protein
MIRQLLGLGPRAKKKPEKPPDLRTSSTWLWSVEKRIAHRPSCPRVGNIRKKNLRGTSDPDELRAKTIDGCRVCLAVNGVRSREIAARDGYRSSVTGLEVVNPHIITVGECQNGLS